MSRFRIGRRRTIAASVVAVLALLGGSSAAIAAPSQASGQGGGNQALEVNVTNSPTDLNGRPTIAVNPRDPNNLVFTATVFGSAVAASAPCFLAYSMDRGRTWTQVPWPLGLPADPDDRTAAAFDRMSTWRSDDRDEPVDLGTAPVYVHR